VLYSKFFQIKIVTNFVFKSLNSNVKSGKLKSDVECQLKQYEYAVNEFQSSKTSLSVGLVEIDATRLLLTNEEFGGK